MKLIVRAFVFALVATGASAAAVSFHSTSAVATTSTSQFMSAAAPMPACAPGGCTSQTGK